MVAHGLGTTVVEVRFLLRAPERFCMTNIDDDLYQLIRHKSLNGGKFDVSQDLKSYIASNEHRGYNVDNVTAAINNLINLGQIVIRIEAVKSTTGFYVQTFADLSVTDKALSS